MFQGFTDETIGFLWGIRMNNSREWFADHKKDYQKHLYEPMKALSAEVSEEMREECRAYGLAPTVARIYRDARRIHGKGPYKESLWFVLQKPAEDWTSTPAFYFEVMPTGYEYGMGFYASRPIQMEVYRRRILRDPGELEALARRLNGQETFVLVGDEYKRSKGEVSELLKPWFNRKSLALIATRKPDGLLLSPELKDTLVEAFRWLLPYYGYLRRLEQEPLPET